jgi:toxin FitB
VRDRDRRELRTTAITLAEIRYGIARLPDGRRKQVLLAAADETFTAFADQVVPVDAAAAEHYAIIASSRERAGKPIAGFDALIAAICRSRGAALATRNVSDFDGTGIEVIDPWLQPPG